MATPFSSHITPWPNVTSAGGWAWRCPSALEAQLTEPGDVNGFHIFPDPLEHGLVPIQALRKPRKKTNGARWSCQGRPLLPPAHLALAKAAALPCRCVGQWPSSHRWERSPRHPGMPKPPQPASPLPGLRSPWLWLPPERLGSSEAGGERLGQHTQHLCESQQFPAPMENACLAHRSHSAKEGMKDHVAHQPVPTTPAHIPQGSAAEPKMGPTSHQCPTGT